MSEDLWQAMCRDRIEATMEREQLSPRQREVAWRLVAGRGNAWIADDLCISPLTVKNHITNIADRMEIDRYEASLPRMVIVVRLLGIEGLGPEEAR